MLILGALLVLIAFGSFIYMYFEKEFTLLNVGKAIVALLFGVHIFMNLMLMESQSLTIVR